MGQKSGLVVETGEGNVKAMVWGWGAIILGVAVAVSSIILSSAIGLALTLVSGGLGVALVAVGVGEGVRRARLGRAAEIAARAQLAAVRRGQLPPWTER